MWDASHEQIVRMDGLIKNLIEPARSEEALPRGSVSIVKTDFLNKLKRSANALRFTFDFRKAVYNSRCRYRAARTQGKPLQHK